MLSICCVQAVVNIINSFDCLHTTVESAGEVLNGIMAHGTEGINNVSEEVDE